jgi:hypothetical protein
LQPGSLTPAGAQRYQPRRLRPNLQAWQKQEARQRGPFANSKSEFTIEQEQMSGGPEPQSEVRIA